MQQVHKRMETDNDGRTIIHWGLCAQLDFFSKITELKFLNEVLHVHTLKSYTWDNIDVYT